MNPRMIAFVVLASFGAPAGAQLTDGSGDWTISVRYPRFSAKGPVARAANAAMATREKALFRAFLKRARAEVRGLKEYNPNATYMLTVRPHRITDRAGLASGYVDRYDFLAGAHGTSRYEVVNYGRVGGRVRALRLRDLFLPGTDARREASRGVLATVRATGEEPSRVESGEWAGLTAAEAERFVVGPKGILFLFDQYELGVGAEGSPAILVPFSRLRGLDRRGVLASVVGKP